MGSFVVSSAELVGGRQPIRSTHRTPAVKMRTGLPNLATHDREDEPLARANCTFEGKVRGPRRTTGCGNHQSFEERFKETNTAEVFKDKRFSAQRQNFASSALK